MCLPQHQHSRRLEIILLRTAQDFCAQPDDLAPSISFGCENGRSDSSVSSINDAVASDHRQFTEVVIIVVVLVKVFVT